MGLQLKWEEKFPEKRVLHNFRQEKAFSKLSSPAVVMLQGVEKMEGGKWSNHGHRPE